MDMEADTDTDMADRVACTADCTAADTAACMVDYTADYKGRTACKGMGTGWVPLAGLRRTGRTAAQLADPRCRAAPLVPRNLRRHLHMGHRAASRTVAPLVPRSLRLRLLACRNRGAGSKAQRQRMHSLRLRHLHMGHRAAVRRRLLPRRTARSLRRLRMDRMGNTAMRQRCHSLRLRLPMGRSLDNSSKLLLSASFR